MTTDDVKALARIQKAADKLSTAKRKLADANSAKLKEPKDALKELSEAVKASRGSSKGDAPGLLKAIQEAEADRLEAIQTTQDAWQDAKKKFNAADTAFWKSIADSKQGELPGLDEGAS